MKVRHSRKLPLRFYFDTVAERDAICKRLAEIGADNLGPYIQINGPYGKIFLNELKTNSVTLRIGSHKIILESGPV